jgi:hypothetical protein
MPGTTIRSEAAKYLGCTNRAYESHVAAMDDQMGWVCALLIDIDGADNPTLKTHELIETVCRVAGDGVSVRLSCGGKGLHVIRRLSTPVLVPPGAGSKVFNAVTTLLNEDLVHAIEGAGVEVCKYDSRMFWLCGGSNVWVMKSEGLTPTPPKFERFENARVSDTRAVPIDPGLDPFVSSWLQRLNVRPGAVYVGDVVAKLRGLGETVKTKSGMTGNGQINGYIDVRPGEIGLWSYADGCTIWRAMDESYPINGCGGDS